MKCLECGTEFDEALEACPNCGCPVQDTSEAIEQREPVAEPEKPEEKPPRKKADSAVIAKLIRIITAIVIAAIGAVVIVLGTRLMEEPAQHTIGYQRASYSAQSFDVEYAKFGADFYSYIYGASDTIVDELNAINKALETVVSAENSISNAVSANINATDDLNRAVCEVGGTVVIAIGLGIVAYSLQCFGTALVPSEASKKRDDV